MANGAAAVRGHVPVSYHQFFLGDCVLVPSPVIQHSNGLSVVRPGIVSIFTGVNAGQVRVTVDVRSEPPASAELDPWEVVVEASVCAPTETWWCVG